MFGIVPRLQAQVVSQVQNEKLRGLLNHPAGPFTIHFWAPTAKWAISIANIADLQRPVESVSVPQQLAVSATGIIWSRYATQIVPVNYNLLAVNALMACTGLWHIARIVNHYYGSGASAGASAGAGAGAGASAEAAPSK